MWLNISKINSIWFFDATGLIHRQINRQPKPFFYSICSHDTQKEIIVPVAEFVTTSNDQISIGNYLRELKMKLEIGTSKNVLPRIIVTDMGWALINAIMQVFNNCDMTGYLEWCSDYLFFDEKTSAEMTIYYTCSTHFLKNMIRKAKSKFLYTQMRRNA